MPKGNGYKCDNCGACEGELLRNIPGAASLARDPVLCPGCITSTTEPEIMVLNVVWEIPGAVLAPQKAAITAAIARERARHVWIPG